ncbi:MAG: ABC transporter permease [Thermoplasmataceae archaeon]
MISTSSQIRVYMEQNLQFYLRTRRFIVFLVLVALITALIYSLMAFKVIAVPSDEVGFDTLFYSFVGDVVLILGSFLGGDAMATDFSLKTGTFVLSQPSKRLSILLGRYLGALAVGAAIITLYYILGALGMVYLFHGVPVGVGESYLLALLYTASAIGFGFLFSSMFKNGSSAIVATFLVMFLIFSIVQGVLDVTKIEPWFLLTYGGGVVTTVLSPLTFTHIHVLNEGRVSVTTYTPYVWEGIAIMVGYLAISLIISILIYNRRQI